MTGLERGRTDGREAADRVLAGDIGGTNTRLGLFEPAGRDLVELALEVFPSGAYRGLEDIVREFLGRHPAPVLHACFGIAGPVRAGRVDATNLPWIVDRRHLSFELGIPQVTILNDLHATASGIPFLRPDDVLVLQEGDPSVTGNAALIAAGTGLGEAGLFWDGARFLPFATEGGHTSFAPSSEQEIDLLRYLARRYGHVSWERLVSGPGLVHIYEFVVESRHESSPSWLLEQMRIGDAAAAISAAALSGRSETCADALELFVHLYGSEAGNLALKTLAFGGVYIGGGIAPKIVRALEGPAFLQALRNKGRMAHLLEAMPVRLILNERTALLGSAACAAEL